MAGRMKTASANKEGWRYTGPGERHWRQVREWKESTGKGVHQIDRNKAKHQTKHGLHIKQIQIKWRCGSSHLLLVAEKIKDFWGGFKESHTQQSPECTQSHQLQPWNLFFLHSRPVVLEGVRGGGSAGSPHRIKSHFLYFPQKEFVVIVCHVKVF